jgi:glycolate oxidase
LTGGARPANGGVDLAFEKHMNKILEIDMQNMVAVVEPGVINMDLQKAVSEKGLFYPPDPASQDYSSIGGNVAENAGGMRAAKYGITKDYVMALRAVLPSGEVIQAGKKTIIDVAGYYVAGIFIASEGYLGVITQITLKLIKKPKIKKTAMGVFSTVEEAMNAVYKTMASGVTPVAMEFLDNLTIKAVEQKFNKGLPTDAGAILITDVDGNLEEDIETQLLTIKKVFSENGSTFFKIAKDENESNELWFARRNASQSISIYGSKKLNEDITVPRSKLPQLLEKIEKISKKYNVNTPCFGHTGDGNVHTNVMVDGSNEDELKRGYEAIEEIFKVTVELGGTLSGEHGIGLSKAPYMKLAFSEAELNLFKAIKKAFDPNNILNPFKMGI